MEFGPSPIGGLGIFAKEHIKKGSPLISVPWSVRMDRGFISRDPYLGHLGFASNESLARVAPHCAMAAYLLYYRAVVPSRIRENPDVECFYGHVMANFGAMPASYDDLPELWTRKELRHLSGMTDVYFEVLKKIEKHRNDFRVCKEAVFDRFPDVFPQRYVNLHQYLDAYMLSSTRSFYVGGDFVMLPGIGMVNGDNPRRQAREMIDGKKPPELQGRGDKHFLLASREFATDEEILAGFYPFRTFSVDRWFVKYAYIPELDSGYVPLDCVKIGPESISDSVDPACLSPSELRRAQTPEGFAKILEKAGLAKRLKLNGVELIERLIEVLQEKMERVSEGKLEERLSSGAISPDKRDLIDKLVRYEQSQFSAILELCFSLVGSDDEPQDPWDEF